MPRLSLWKPNKTNDYYFFDRLVKEQLEVGGTDILLHKYLGPRDSGVSDDPTQPNYSAQGGADETTIQDLLFQENRDRRYDPNIYQIRAHYPVQDNEFDLSQFGLMLANGTVFLVIHLNNMIDILGRKVISGDVIELPHLRDDALLDETKGAINQYYQVEEATRAAEGFSPTWYPHLWRLKLKPLTDSPEFSDILGTGENEDDLKNILSSYNTEIGISEAIVAAAEQAVPERNFETAHLYVVPGQDYGRQYPWVFAGDGKPPNGAEPLGSGPSFPVNAQENDYWLRTDYEPNILYRKCGRHWLRIEVDYARTWRTAHRILESFINNKNKTTLNDGTIIDQKQDIKKAVKPRADV